IWFVIPATAGIYRSAVRAFEKWIPACAGMTFSMRSKRSIAAGHVDRHAGDKIGVSGCQKADHLGLVGRFGDAAQRGALDLGLLVLRARLVPARPDPLGQGTARRDRVDRDPEGPELEGELAGKGDDAAFGGGIGAAAGGAEAAAGDRRQVD